MVSKAVYLLCFLAGLLTAVVRGASDYSEQLLLQPLPSASLLASFNFRGNESLVAFEQQNFRYFPRSLGQILQHADTKELHARFTTGRWDAESWGERPWHGFKEGGTGVELWAWIEADDEERAFEKWISLTQSLSGLFCASLNFIDSTRTTRPVVSFDPTGDHSESASALHFLHGTLPGEVVCTENLTPFLKLLPCKGKAGIGSLLDGHKLFDASWQSMSIDVRPSCPGDGAQCQVEIEQTVDMVLDIERSKRPKDNPIPRPVAAEQLSCDESKPYNSDDTCYPASTTASSSWSLVDIFGRTIPSPCPLVEEGEKSVCIKVSPDREVLASAGVIETLSPDGLSHCYSLSEGAAFDLVLPAAMSPPEVTPGMPILHAERTTIGHGQERGGMRSILTNPSNTTTVDFVYFETLPWFMRLYLHTLKTAVRTRNSLSEAAPSSDIVREVYYRPAVDRHRGSQLELILSVPPASTVTLVYEFEKSILRYTEYPPDANRGFNIAPAVIRILKDSSANSLSTAKTPIYLRTTSLLLPLPTPDFSMPYNVIILTSTVMALAFGNIFNLLVRRFVGAEEVPRRNIKDLVRGKLVALRDKYRGKAVKTE